MPEPPKTIRDASHINRTENRNQSKPCKTLRRAASGRRCRCTQRYKPTIRASSGNKTTTAIRTGAMVFITATCNYGQRVSSAMRRSRIRCSVWFAFSQSVDRFSSSTLRNSSSLGMDLIGCENPPIHQNHVTVVAVGPSESQRVLPEDRHVRQHLFNQHNINKLIW